MCDSVQSGSSLEGIVHYMKFATRPMPRRSSPASVPGERGWQGVWQRLARAGSRWLRAVQQGVAARTANKRDAPRADTETALPREGRFVEGRGPDASREMLRFLLQHLSCVRRARDAARQCCAPHRRWELSQACCSMTHGDTMKTTDDNAFESMSQPRPQPVAQGPIDEALHARSELLAKLDLHFDGLGYCYRDRRFELFTDAVAYARHAAADDRADDGFAPAGSWTFRTGRGP